MSICFNKELYQKKKKKNALIGSLAMHHFDYRGEVWGLRFSSALKGLIYLKVRI